MISGYDHQHRCLNHQATQPRLNRSSICLVYYMEPDPTERVACTTEASLNHLSSNAVIRSVNSLEHLKIGSVTKARRVLVLSASENPSPHCDSRSLGSLPQDRESKSSLLYTLTSRLFTPTIPDSSKANTAYVSIEQLRWACPAAAK